MKKKGGYSLAEKTGASVCTAYEFIPVNLANIVSIWFLQRESNIIHKHGIILKYFKPPNSHALGETGSKLAITIS